MELNLRIELKLNKIVQIQSTILKVTLTFFMRSNSFVNSCFVFWVF